MAIPTPDPGPADILRTLAALTEANLSDPGYVLATGEFVKDNAVTAKGLRRESDPQRVKGVSIQYVGGNESFGNEEDEFFNVFEHRIKVRIMKSYRDDDFGDADNSKGELLTAMWEFAAILRNNPSLGYGDDVEVRPLQMPEDIDEDSDQLMGTFHVCPIDVYVTQRLYAGFCDD